MNINECYLLGTFIKVNGVKGEVVLKSNYLLSEEFESIPSVFIEIDGILVPFFITNFISRSNFSALIKLEDIDSIPAAKEFIGNNIYILKEYLPNIEETFELSNFIGYTIIDNINNMIIGKVSDTLNIPNNPLVQVNYNNNDVLIPANNETIISIDNKNMSIRINIAEGLLQINL